MNYQQFLEYKKILLSKNPRLINLAENNLYEYFSIPKYTTPQSTVYRCHLVEDYLKYLSLPDSFKPYVGASAGVRASLSVLFKELPNWTIPQDVYPFYQQELSKNNLKFKEYQTLTNDSLFSQIENGTLLLTFPLKPNARDYRFEEFQNLFNFLQKNPQNLIVIDMVYWLNQYLPHELLKLYETNQVILTHSLSKCFLIPNHFGITLFPRNVQGQNLRECFKSLPKEQEKLDQAYQALHTNLELTQVIKEKIITNTIQVEKLLKESLFQSQENPQYLFYKTQSPESFLEKNILVIPESVFGGIGAGSILSILI